MRAQDQAAIVHIIRKEMPYLSKQFGVQQISLFGSFARDEAKDTSDIDLLVSLSKPLGLSFFSLADYLESKLGRKVDLITEATLERGFSDPRRAHIAKAIQESLIHV